MTKPQIRVMIDAEDFEHLVAGGELRVETSEGIACICIDDIGFLDMKKILHAAERYMGNRLGQVRERGPRR